MPTVPERSPSTDLPIQIQVDGRIFISGQIGLVPSSLSVPSPQTLSTEIPLVSQHSDRVVKALSSRHGGGGGRLGRDSDDDGHAQMILYWATEERHISYSIMAAQRLDVRESHSKILMLGVFHAPD
jgi:diphthine-ammonia ligase